MSKSVRHVIGEFSNTLHLRYQKKIDIIISIADINNINVMTLNVHYVPVLYIIVLGIDAQINKLKKVNST